MTSHFPMKVLVEHGLNHDAETPAFTCEIDRELDPLGYLHLISKI